MIAGSQVCYPWGMRKFLLTLPMFATGASKLATFVNGLGFGFIVGAIFNVVIALFAGGPLGINLAGLLVIFGLGLVALSVFLNQKRQA
jgi:hypothetical protein